MDMVWLRPEETGQTWTKYYLAADDDVRAIAQARQLQQLELNGVQGVAAAAPSSLTALTSLLHLSLAYLDVPDQADDEMIKQHAAVWSTLPVLHRLKVRRCRFSPGTAAAIAAALSVTSRATRAVMLYRCRTWMMCRAMF